LNSAFRIWASIVSLAIIVQVGLASYGAFNAVDKADDKGTIGKDAVSDGFSAHAALGYIIFLAALILLILALVSRRAGDPGRVKWSGAVLGLIVIQILLAWAGGASAGLGVLHGMNALAVAGVAGSLAGREWAAHRGAGGARASEPTARV
jgi:heme A synthase